MSPLKTFTDRHRKGPILPPKEFGSMSLYSKLASSTRSTMELNASRDESIDSIPTIVSEPKGGGSGGGGDRAILDAKNAHLARIVREKMTKIYPRLAAKKFPTSKSINTKDLPLKRRLK